MDHRRKPAPMFTCRHCGEVSVRNYYKSTGGYDYGQIYCSWKCKCEAARIPVPTFTCQQCGKVTARKKMAGNGGYNYSTKMCSPQCQHDSQRGTGYIHHSGYRVHSRGGKQVAEHREVMEQMIGRSLLPQETVHHKNGVRSDNGQENLELWSTRNPMGQRVSDKIKWAEEFLPQYGLMVSKPPSDSAWVNGLLYC